MARTYAPSPGRPPEVPLEPHGGRTTGNSLGIGNNLSTVLRWADDTLRRQPNGRYSAKSTDRLVRELKVPTPTGPIEITIRGSREASRIANYWNALERYYRTGDASGLQRFRGLYVTDTRRQRIPFLTDLDVLNRLGSAGVVSFESIYARTA